MPFQMLLNLLQQTRSSLQDLEDRLRFVPLLLSAIQDICHQCVANTFFFHQDLKEPKDLSYWTSIIQLVSRCCTRYFPPRSWICSSGWRSVYCYCWRCARTSFFSADTHADSCGVQCSKGWHRCCCRGCFNNHGNRLFVCLKGVCTISGRATLYYYSTSYLVLLFISSGVVLVPYLYSYAIALWEGVHRILY